MRTFSIVSTLVVLLTSVWLVPQAHAQWPQTTQYNQWSVEFGAKAFDRPGSQLGIPLISDSITLAPVFDTNMATDLGSTFGGEIRFNFQASDGSEWEIRSYLAQWNEQSETLQGPNLFSPFFPNNIVPDHFTYGYDSDIFNIELNKKRAFWPGVVGLGGARLISTKDLVSLQSDLLVDPNNGLPPVLIESLRQTEATNFLMGLQGGLEFNRPLNNSVYGQAFIKIGGYYNPTEVTTSDDTSINPAVIVNRQTKSTGSFVGEVGGKVYWDFVPNCAAIYVGYEAMWIDGIALAPPQLLIDPAMPSIETSNTPFFQSINFGFKFTR